MLSIYVCVQMGAEMERVQRERDSALERLEKQSGGSQVAEDELAATRKQMRSVEVHPRGCSSWVLFNISGMWLLHF